MVLTLHNLPVHQSTHLPNHSEILLKNIEIAEAADNNLPRQHMAKEMPAIEHKYDISNICKLLHRIALSYVGQMQEAGLEPAAQKLNHEFYVVCMLNALFGDPRVHLIKLHPRYGQTAAIRAGSQGGSQVRPGLKEFEKMQQFLAGKSFDDAKQRQDTGKIRRNAVAELLRFVCQVEHHVACDRHGDDERAYASAYKMLLNGDLVSATRFLSQRGKHNLAMCLSQSLSASDFHKASIRSHAA